MAKHPQDIFKIYFADQSIGIDLGNVEIKYSSRMNPEWVVKKHDYDSDFIVFYSSFQDTWYFLNTNELQPIKKPLHRFSDKNKDYHRTIKLNHVKKFAYCIAATDDEMMVEMEQIVKNPSKYLKWIKDLRINIQQEQEECIEES